jgi:hypothetical protein
MFGTIRKHQTWLWAIIITLTIISFVIFFSPYSKLDNSNGGKPNYGSINGEPVTQEQFAKAWREVQLRHFFMSGRWPDDDARRMGFEPERDTYQWLLLLQKVEEAGIHPGADTVAQTARQMLDQFQRAGISSADAFFTQVLGPRGISVDDFERYVRHTLAVQELIATVGVSGKLVTPQEARELFIRENQEVSSDALFFSASNYVTAVTVNPDAVAQFYTNRQADYRIPERAQVTYVQFGVSNYLQQAEAELAKTNLAEVVDLNLQRLGTNYTRLGATPEEAKAKIREELVRNEAFNLARRKASEFANELFDKEPVAPGNLETLAKAKGLMPQVTQPFDRREGPKELKVGPNFVTAAFGLSPTNDPFGGPLPGEDGVYVIAYNKRLSSEVPPLDQVREKVTADYRHDQAVVLARRAGIEAHRSITNQMAQGKNFEAACAEAKVNPVPLPPLSISTRSLPGVDERVSLSELKQVAFSTNPGNLSPLQYTREGGFILYVKAKLPINEDKLKTELPNFVSNLQQQRLNEAFNEWFKKQAEKGLRDTPLAQPKPTPPSMGGASTPPATPAAKKS